MAIVLPKLFFFIAQSRMESRLKNFYGSGTDICSALYLTMTFMTVVPASRNLCALV